MVYSFTTQCVKCLATFPLAHAQAGEDDAARGVCPECGEGLNRHVQVKGYVPIETSYICKGQCKPKRGYRSAKSRGKSAREYFRELDLGRIKEVEKKTIPFTYPNNRGRRF